MHISTNIVRLARLDVSPLPNNKPGTDYASNIWTTSLNIVTVTMTVVAVLMIVLNGFKYITAAGDPQKMSQARSGLLFAIIGLIVIWSARTIVVWALRGLL